MLSWESGLSGHFRHMEDGLVNWLADARSKARRSRRGNLAPTRMAAKAELLLERTKGLPDPEEGQTGWEPKLVAAHEMAIAQRAEMRQMLEAAQQHAKEVLRPRHTSAWLRRIAPHMQGESLGAAGGEVVEVIRSFLELCEQQDAAPLHDERTQAA